MKTRLAIILLVAASFLPMGAASSILDLKHSITDDSIKYPESIETDTHRMLCNWYLQNYAVLNAEQDATPDHEVTDEVLISRLSKIPTTIEMPFNQVVRSYINMYTQRRRQLVENMLGMSLYYMPIFEEALERHGLPLELRYLPVIESALNPDAVSKAGATGLWQFMLPTARGLGLEVTTLVDERRDPRASSEAAALYLKQLYGMYNDWSLAIAAYNCGPGNINKALRRAGGENPKGLDFWSIYYLLPEETRGYVPAFIAANYVMQYYREHNISPALARRPLITDSVHVRERVNLQQIADVIGLPVEELRVLNPQYRKDIIPGDVRPYSLVLPAMQIYSFILSSDSIYGRDRALYASRKVVDPAAAPGEDPNMEYTTRTVTKYHKVKRGETLTSIANHYGVTVADIKKWNKLKKNAVNRGRNLKIQVVERVATGRRLNPDPADMNAQQQAQMAQQTADTASAADVESLVEAVNSTHAAAAPAPEKKAAPAKKARQTTYITHTVRKGESLFRISKKYRNVTVAEIQAANGLKSTDLQVGQKLKIPKK